MSKRIARLAGSQVRLRKKLVLLHWSFGVILFILVPAARILVSRDFSISWFIPATLLLCTEGAISYYIAGLVHSDARVPHWRTSNAFVACFILFSAVLSMGVCLLCSWVSLIAPLKTVSGIRSPMGKITEIHVDREGFIYCADHIYSRLQVFDGNGHFVRGWLVPNLGVGVRVSVTEDGNVQTTHVNDRLHILCDR